VDLCVPVSQPTLIRSNYDQCCIIVARASLNRSDSVLPVFRVSYALVHPASL